MSRSIIIHSVITIHLLVEFFALPLGQAGILFVCRKNTYIYFQYTNLVIIQMYITCQSVQKKSYIYCHMWYTNICNQRPNVLSVNTVNFPPVLGNGAQKIYCIRFNDGSIQPHFIGKRSCSMIHYQTQQRPKLSGRTLLDPDSKIHNRDHVYTQPQIS